ncbi:MAG: hypothetical protein CBD18_05300 [Opitutales bacterium TMED158]|nr:MAG: hypothetical protein CBD18_05300 [Opitutales bacterium TMED158]
MPVSIIAEIGVNHDGKVDQAKQLIDEAKRCGADCVKFQTFDANRLASSDTPKVDYQHRGTTETESHVDMLRKLQLPSEAFATLKDYCDKVGIEFLSTPYSVEDARFLNELGVSRFKTASADLVDRELHEYLATLGKPVLIATGMATLQEIDVTLSLYPGNGENVALLHCTSAYPADPADANLRAISLLSTRYPKCAIGYSDHTPDEVSAVAAIALGACLIEKHFTLDKRLPGPDHAASADPETFERYVKALRQTEISLGSPTKEPVEAEKGMRSVSRKSLHSSEALGAGSKIDRSKVRVCRPNDGISAMDLPKVLGKTLRVNLAASEPITWNDLED